MHNHEHLLLAAFAPELAGLDENPPPGWSVALTGIGGLTAAAATARILNEFRPHRVLFIGTCGAYGDSLKIGDCIAVSEVISISVSEMQHRAYRPEVEVFRWHSNWEFDELHLLHLPKYCIATPPAITSNIEDAALLGQIAQAENLELAGVFAACQLADTPVAAALVVANQVGSDAHSQWRANHESLSQKLVGMLSDQLGSISRNH